MAFNLMVLREGIGKKLTLKTQLKTYANSLCLLSPLESELATAKHLLLAAGIHGTFLDRLVLVNSLPKAHQALMPQSIVSGNAVNVAHTIEIGNHCGALLDAIYYCFLAAAPTERTAILCADSFESRYSVESASQPWLDGGGVILIDPQGDLEIKLKSFITSIDTDFLEQSHIYGSQLMKNSFPRASSKFNLSDVENELNVISMALESGGVPQAAVDGIVVVNRSDRRISEIAKHIPCAWKIYSSRQSFGHRGGADIIENLRIYFESNNFSNARNILLLGNGLGYVWNCILLECKKV